MRGIHGQLTIMAVGASVWLACVWLVGCGGGAGPGNPGGPNSGPGTPAADCAQTSADALVSLDEDPSSDLVATAVTSDCDEIAVFSGDGQDVRQAVIVTRDQQLTAEFDSSGQLLAARTTEDQSVNVSYNDGLSYARVTYEDDNGTASTLVSIPRDEDERDPSQNRGALAVCPPLRQFAALLRAECDGPNPPRYCSGAVSDARAAVVKLCSSDRVEEVEGITGLNVASQRTPLPLGVDGFATTRAAAGGGTTLILSSSAFGGRPPYEIRWRQRSGPSTALTQLPGGAAIADASAATGRFAFDVAVTDAAGAQAEALVDIDLGDAGFAGVVIQGSNLTPAVGASVTFTAASAAERLASGATPRASAFWDFGDGAAATGRTVDHQYARVGVYQATVAVAVGDEILTDTVQVEVGGAVPELASGVFRIELAIAESPFLTVGDRRDITVEVQGAIGGAEVAIGILEGFDAGDLEGSGLVEEDFVLGTSAVLRAVGPGLVLLGAVAVDAAGRLAEAVQTVAVCADDSGLLVFVDGPELLRVGEPGLFEASGAACRGDVEGLTFQWSIAGGSAEIATPTGIETEIIPGTPGPLQVRVEVVGVDGGRATGSLGVFVGTEGLAELFVEFLGPFGIPPGADVPLAVFVSETRGPTFCSWRLEDGAVEVLDPFSCDTSVRASAEGCVEGEVFVEDGLGGVGFSAVEICADSSFEVPSESCQRDGVCDLDCPFLDPDCLEEEFCVTGDFLCDELCEGDSDCNACGADGVCIFLCPAGDPDCERELCVSGDGICDFGCPVADADCGFAACAPGDGVCDAFCPEPDPDCADLDAQICEEEGACCNGDQNCELGTCPELDSDCAFCLLDGVCVGLCPQPDPDCPACDLTFGCDAGCPEDPDCVEDCDVTFGCDPNCPDDPECVESCDVSFFCDPFCPDDPNCLANCDLTFACDPFCPLDPECTLLCDLTFACDPDCPGDPECIPLCDLTFACDPNCPGDPECPR